MARGFRKPGEFPYHRGPGSGVMIWEETTVGYLGISENWGPFWVSLGRRILGNHHSFR